MNRVDEFKLWGRGRIQAPHTLGASKDLLRFCFTECQLEPWFLAELRAGQRDGR